MDRIDYYKKYEPIFGNWYIKRIIGEGSFGRVCEIERHELGATYRAALKIITVPQSQSEVKSILADGMSIEEVTEYYKNIVLDIVKESELMSRLKGNTNIVSYEDHLLYEHSNGIGWDILIKMELLTPFLEHMSKNSITAKDVTRLGKDICRALVLCENNQIIHRDIKPENIFVTNNGDYKLGDFGIARTLEKTSGGLSKKGTYTYMAPEIYRGEAYGPNVDIYSLGIVMYWLLNKRRTPFLPAYPNPISYNDRESALLKRIGGETIPRPLLGDDDLANIVLKACEFNPQERYHSANEMLIDLEKVYKKQDNVIVFDIDQHKRQKEKVSKNKEDNAAELGDDETVLLHGTNENNTSILLGDNFKKTLTSKQITHYTETDESLETVRHGNTSQNYDKVQESMIKQPDNLSGNNPINEMHILDNMQMASDEKMQAEEIASQHHERLKGKAQLIKYKKNATEINSKKGKAKKKSPRIMIAIVGLLLIVSSIAIILNSRIRIGSDTFYSNATDVSIHEGKITEAQLKKIHRFRKLDTLRLNNCSLEDSDIEIIADELSQIHSEYGVTVSISGNSGVTSILPLADKLELHNLDISGTSVSDLSSLENEESLVELRADKMEVGLDTDSISKIKNLEKIYVKENNLSTLDFLKDSSKLFCIDASDNNIQDINGLEDMISISTLDLSNNDISTLDALEGSIDRLRTLYAENNSIYDISALKGAINIEDLNLSNNQISDISALKELLEIEYLSLSNNSIKDIESLTDLQKLRKVELSHNQIDDFDAFSRTYDVFILDISDNNIKDVSNLKNMPELKHLYINDNEIEDISFVSELPKLESVKLYNNKIRDIAPLGEFSENITKGWLMNNNISDFSCMMKYGGTLNMHGNPITDFSCLRGATFDIMSISYGESVNWDSLSGLNLSNTIVEIIDSPKNMEVELEKKIPAYSIRFRTKNEADAWLSEDYEWKPE